MAYRPTWQGHLKLSLVTCPVALYTATNAGGDVHFNLSTPRPTTASAWSPPIRTPGRSTAPIW